MRLLAVPDAATVLGVNRSRIHALIRSGELSAEKTGNRWLVDPLSVERRRSAHLASGRPLSPQNAFAILWLASGREVEWLPPDLLSRTRKRLRTHDLITLAPQLRNRCSTHHLRIHESELGVLLADGRVVASGISAAETYRFDISAAGEAEGYARELDLPTLVQEFALEQSTAPNLTLRTLTDFWPFGTLEIAPIAAAALDLTEATEMRTRRAGLRALRALSDD